MHKERPSHEEQPRPTAMFISRVMVSIRPSPASFAGSASSLFASDIATCKCHLTKISFLCFTDSVCTPSRYATMHYAVSGCSHHLVLSNKLTESTAGRWRAHYRGKQCLLSNIHHAVTDWSSSSGLEGENKVGVQIEMHHLMNMSIRAQRGRIEWVSISASKCIHWTGRPKRTPPDIARVEEFSRRNPPLPSIFLAVLVDVPFFYH